MNKISLIVNLRKGLLGTAVQLKLEDINVVGSFHDGIGSSFGTSHFSLGELSHELEDEVKNGLIMTFRAVVQLVRDSGKESSQAGKEGIGITFPTRMNLPI